MRFRSNSFGFLALLWLLLPANAKADTYDWQYQGTSSNLGNGLLSSGSGELTAVNGVITGLSGTFNGVTIAGLLAPNAFVGNDNLLLFPGQPYLTTGGVSFVDSNYTQINMYASTGTDNFGNTFFVYASIEDNQLFNDIGNFTLEPIATPEPGTSALLFTGMLGLGLLARCGQMRRNATN